MKTLKTKNTTIETFASVNEFINILNAATPNKAFKNRSYLASEIKGDAAWSGTESFEDAQKLMKQGYKEGCKNLLQCKEGIKVSFEGTQKKTYLHYVGATPCVSAVLQGRMKTMYFTKKEKKNAPVINLYYDMSANCNVNAETLTLAGKNIYSLVQYLEKNHVKVNLYSIIGTCIYDKYSFIAVRIKADAAPVNPQLISYPLIHPSFMRRHFFKWVETSKATQHHRGQYGSAANSCTSNIIGLLQDTKLLNKESFYCDWQNASNAQDINDLMLRIGLKL